MMPAMQTSSRLRRHHRTDIEKAELVTAYQRSGLSQRDFALRHGIAPSNIGRWVRRSQEAETSRAAAVVEVPNLLLPTRGDHPYRVHFPQGLSLEIARGFAAKEVCTLAQLLKSL
jgi:hypothetical protein